MWVHGRAARLDGSGVLLARFVCVWSFTEEVGRMCSLWVSDLKLANLVVMAAIVVVLQL